jgi:hypothetical protein
MWSSITVLPLSLFHSSYLVLTVLIYATAYIGIIKVDPFSVPIDEWIAGLNINFISAYAAIQEAIAGFRQLPASTLKTITFTGNLSIHKAIPLFMNLGVSKNAAAHMIECGTVAHYDITEIT